MESKSPTNMGNPSPLLHWMDNPIIPYTEPSPIFQDPDGQFYSLGMEMPMYDGEGRDHFSESYLASSFYAHVDSGSPSRVMDYIYSPQVIHLDHANVDHTGSQSEVSFDYPSFLIDGSANLTITGEVVGLVSTETEHNSCWDHPGLASRARQFLEISSQQPESMADLHLPWPGSYINPSMSPGFGSSSSLGMPPPGIESSALSIPSPGIDLSSLGMPSSNIDSLPPSILSLSRSLYTGGGSQDIDQVSAAQTSSAGQSLQVPRDILGSPSPVRSQPAITSAKDYQDQILKQDRQNGLSYKQIKEMRNFGVSESTLRGRYRNLMKSSHQRPRKPTWTLADVELLKVAVPLFTLTAGSRRVSWKAVSEFIHTHGDSPYTFAYATCHKQWLDLIKRGLA
ncbi:hypothetical protein E4U61_000721 [Claviceps capensis]|nr:hypothetical protein E4U61_000721 [Claviceps capensis]